MHADSQPPAGLVAIISRTLADPSVVLGGFRVIITAPDGSCMRFQQAHHWAKTYYMPALLMPLRFCRCGSSLVPMHAQQQPDTGQRNALWPSAGQSRAEVAWWCCRGLRCLLGDQTMFCRAADFHAAGGEGIMPCSNSAAGTVLILHRSSRVSRGPGAHGGCGPVHQDAPGRALP